MMKIQTFEHRSNHQLESQKTSTKFRRLVRRRKLTRRKELRLPRLVLAVNFDLPSPHLQKELCIMKTRMAEITLAAD